MKILSIRPTASNKDVAAFDVELSPHLRLFNLTLRRGADGALRIYAAKALGKHSASFHPDLAQEITSAAEAAMGGKQPNGHR